MRGLAASWVITGDGETPPLRDGAVVLDESERIVAVGPAAALRRDFAAVSFRDLSAVLMPGLVNAHTHLELSALRGQVPGGQGFVPWVDRLVSVRAQARPQADAEAIEAAISELLAAGVVAVGDVCNRLEVVDTLGALPLLGCVFHEVFGMRKDTAEVMLGMAQKERASRETWPSNLRYSLAPHTPYTLHPDVLRGIVAQARQSGARTSLHLAEHAAERAFLHDGGGPFAEWVVKRQASALDWRAPGCDSVRYADQLSALGSHVIAVHLCDARADELSLVAERGAKVVLCPRSNLHIEVKLPPLLDILRVGIKPALGTDSLASNSSLDPLAEARALHKRFPTVAPSLLLAMTTSFGADVLGFSQVVGRIQVGLCPGILAFEHGASVPADPERFILDNERASRNLVSQPAFQRISLPSEVHA